MHSERQKVLMSAFFVDTCACVHCAWAVKWLTLVWVRLSLHDYVCLALFYPTQHYSVSTVTSLLSL